MSRIVSKGILAQMRDGLGKGRWRLLKIAAGAVVGIFFLWGLVWMLTPGESQTAATHRQSVQPRQEWGLAVAPTSPCDSREVGYTFQTTKPAAPTMPRAQCSLVLWHKGHCVYTVSYNGNTPKKACDFGKGLEGEYAVNTEYVWSADSAFTDKYRPDPPRNTLLFTFVQ